MLEPVVCFGAHSGVTLEEVVQVRRPLANLYRYRAEAQLGEEEIRGALEQALQAPPSI